MDAEVVSPFPPLLNYRLAPGPVRDLARWVNEYVAGLCAAAPGRIYGLGTVPLQDLDLAAAELEHVAKAGLAGVEIASNVGGASLADSRFISYLIDMLGADRLLIGPTSRRCRGSSPPGERCGRWGCPTPCWPTSRGTTASVSSASSRRSYSHP